MELVYTLKQSENSMFHALGHSDASIVCSCWSKNNLLAYTWEKVVNGYIERYLSIVDPNQPWNSQKIPITSSVTCLQWNDIGKKLLYATSHGACAVWSATMNLTNLWKEKPVFSIDLHGEVILAAAWLCSGSDVSFNLDKMRDIDSREKVTKTSQKPSLTQLGGQPMEGYVVVTGSGIVAVKCLTQIEMPVSAKTELKNVSTNLRIVDIAFNSEGSIVIMASDGNILTPVRFWCVRLNYDDDALRLSLDVDVMPSILLDCVTRDPDLVYTTISHAHFGVNAEQVYICASHTSGSLIETWTYKKHDEVPPDIHPAFVSQSVLEERIKRWKNFGTSSDLPKVLHMTSPRILLTRESTRVSADMKLLNILSICVVLPDNSIRFLHGTSLSHLYSYRISDDIVSNSNSIDIGRKRPFSEDIVSTISHVALSYMSCALAAMDNHCNLILYKVSPCLQKGAPAQIVGHALVQLASFCLWSGNEWWDVLLHIDSNFANHVREQLRQEFGAQPTPLQQMFNSRLLSIEMSIYQRTLRYAEATNCYLKLMFSTILVVFRSLLRPPQNSSDEQALAEKLHDTCTSSFETDINMLVQSVDTDQKILQSLQPLIQWIADTALYLLSVVPKLNQAVTDIPGASLVRSREYLENLRELLVIIQMWKLLKAACAPVFICLNDKLDPLPLVFKVLTEIVRVVSSGDFQGHFPDIVRENCRSLTSQILVPSLDIIKPVNGVLARLHSGTSSFRFEVGKKPANIQMVTRFADMENVMVDDICKVDHLRRVYLGNNPISQWKICSRCGVLSLLYSVQGSVIQFWEQRFALSCICGGSWNVTDTLARK